MGFPNVLFVWTVTVIVIVDMALGSSYSYPFQNANFLSGSPSQVRSDVWTPIAAPGTNPAHTELNITDSLSQQKEFPHYYGVLPTKQTPTQASHSSLPLLPPRPQVRTHPPQRIIHQQPLPLRRRLKPKPKHFNKNNKRRGGGGSAFRRLPSLFFRKNPRKVFFPPDRRTSLPLDRPPAPQHANGGNNNNYPFRFENDPEKNHHNNKKPLFSGTNSGSGHEKGNNGRAPVQNISNRLRSQQLHVLCAFQTVSMGMNGERCIEV